jgi:hypothetical protein
MFSSNLLIELEYLGQIASQPVNQGEINSRSSARPRVGEGAYEQNLWLASIDNSGLLMQAIWF